MYINVFATAKDPFNHRGRAAEIKGGWKIGGNQVTDSSILEGWGIMHARLAKTAWLWTYHTDNFLKLKENMCHKDGKDALPHHHWLMRLLCFWFPYHVVSPEAALEPNNQAFLR